MLVEILILGIVLIISITLFTEIKLSPILTTLNSALINPVT